MDKKYDVYLAGAMGGRPVHDIIAERDSAKRWCKAYRLSYYDPADDEGLEKLKPHSILSTHLTKAQMTAFVKKDLKAVANSRCVLNLTGDIVSDGTCWEMAFAVYYRQIPVFLSGVLRKEGRLMGFTNILCDKIFYTYQGAICEIAKMKKRGLL